MAEACRPSTTPSGTSLFPKQMPESGRQVDADTAVTPGSRAQAIQDRAVRGDC